MTRWEEEKLTVKFAWAITGAGDYIRESVGVVRKAIQEYRFEVMIFLSKAGDKVLKWYKLKPEVEALTSKLRIEKDANTPFVVGPLQRGVYKFLLVMPATSNTVAKIAHGIADTLVTNAVAQAQKANVPIMIFPTDQKPGSITTTVPSGETLTLTTRSIDLENVEKLRTMKGMIVLSHPEELLGAIEQLQK